MRAYSENYKGFTINLELLPEDTQIEDTFDSTVEDIGELRRKIDNGTYLYFCAKVSASKAGVELGCDYLGACLYESVEQFIEPGGYFPDMRETATEEAQKTLTELCGV